LVVEYSCAAVDPALSSPGYVADPDLELAADEARQLIPDEEG